jgi:hypothetical protein
MNQTATGMKQQTSDAGVTRVTMNLEVHVIPVSGLDPKRTSYGSFFAFNDPDGNAWLVQEVTTRLPGRI